MRDSQLLKVIKDRNLLPEDKLKAAIEQKKKLGINARLADVIVRLGYMDAKKMNELVAQGQAASFVDLTRYAVDAEAMEKLPQEFLRKHEFVPLADKKGKILLAMAQPVDIETLEKIQFMTNCLVDTVLASRSQIRSAIEEFYSLSPHERKARAREAAAQAAAAPPSKPIPQSPFLANVLAEILVERGLVTREEIAARLKTREIEA